MRSRFTERQIIRMFDEHEIGPLRLINVDSSQVAPAPSHRSRDLSGCQERELRFAIIKEHLAHITNSLQRLNALIGELETSCGITLGACKPWAPSGRAHPGPSEAVRSLCLIRRMGP